MELNWSTLVLEVINFLVLVWLLKHFLYRPVLAVVEKRQADIAAQLAYAENQNRGAQQLEAQYQGRLQSWQQEREARIEALNQELEAVRKQRLEQLDHDLAAEREKSQVRQTRCREELQHDAESTALAQSGQFAAALLGRLADAHLNERLVSAACEDLEALPPDAWTALNNEWHRRPKEIAVATAYTTAEPLQQRLRQLLKDRTGLNCPVVFRVDGALLAGLEIAVGDWVFRANLRDELKGFAELVPHAPAPH